MILRLLRVYNADNNDSFSKNNFDTLMMLCKPEADWVPYKLNSRPERFIRMGLGGEGLQPKYFYDLKTGSLLLYPIDDENIPTL